MAGGERHQRSREFQASNVQSHVPLTLWLHFWLKTAVLRALTAALHKRPGAQWSSGQLDVVGTWLTLWDVVDGCRKSRKSRREPPH